MEHLRLELSSEQTLRLEELRQTLAEALPPDAAEMVSFPTADYWTCGGTCLWGCDGSCWASCYGWCQGICEEFCSNNCRHGCRHECVWTGI